MNETSKWTKLVRCARQAPPTDDEMPHGFGTRVVARWLAADASAPSVWAVWEWLSPRGLALAAVLMVASLGWNYDLVGTSLTDELTSASTALESLFEL